MAEEIAGEETGRGEPHGPGWEECCDPMRWSGCGAIDLGGCFLVSLVALVAAGGGLFAAVAGVGRTGRLLRREPVAPRGAVAGALHRGVRYYQLRLSARRAGHGGCRYAPTCSAYAAEALRRHGALAGTRLAVRRLRRCRPGRVGGPDPVP